MIGSDSIHPQACPRHSPEEPRSRDSGRAGGGTARLPKCMSG